ncbi:hypothetical protein SLEP1_g7899 [Rubroshorea leprosula]|uniref:Uncharacterized protein n=1 Tax=Rubroshorea leprosula TaxID=152421 RepID=A0AAV5I003_9ROSI|nr:hypothetical protein SLEP1_g7899 [Rubroshorea leprosula]
MNVPLMVRNYFFIVRNYNMKDDECKGIASTNKKNSQ